MVLAEMLAESARKYPKKYALISQEKFLTYEELEREVKKAAAALKRLGVKKGDAIGLLLPNNFQFVIAYYAVAYLGGIIVPMNIMFKPLEITYIMNNAQAKLLITAEAFAKNAFQAKADIPSLEHILVKGSDEYGLRWEELLEWETDDLAAPAVEEDDVLIYLYTSGTTGKPKGAMLTHANLYYNALGMAQRSQASADDIYLCVLPLFHTFAATCCMNTPLSQGGTIVLMENFIPQTLLKNIERYKVTIFTAVPSMYTVIVNMDIKDIDLSSIRLCISGGASLPVEIMEKTQQKMNCVVLEGYGLSETSPVVTFNLLDKVKPGSIGVALEGIETKIFDDNDQECPLGTVGEIVTKGPNVMKGYLGLPEESAKALRNGWLHTGDLGRMDEDGYIFLVDRKKDLVIVAGLNVYPREVEEVIYTHPAVLETAVIGVPDKLRGEALKAVVVLKPGAELREKDIIKYCRERLAAYKVPRLVEFIAELPKNATGKILKRELHNTRK